MASNFINTIDDNNNYHRSEAGKIIDVSLNENFIDNTLGKGTNRNDYSEWISIVNNFYLNQMLPCATIAASVALVPTLM